MGAGPPAPGFTWCPVGKGRGDVAGGPEGWKVVDMPSWLHRAERYHLALVEKHSPIFFNAYLVLIVSFP
jgi:hypothetical protein